MSILPQIAVIVLIAGILLILVRSNRRLAEAAQEGEQFIDEWAIREERRQQILMQTVENRNMDTGSSGNEPEKDSLFPEDEKRRYSPESAQESIRLPGSDYGEEDLPSSYHGTRERLNREYEDEEMLSAELFLIELDENGIPVGRTEIKRLPFRIGRAPENDLVIDDLRVARQHCRIVRNMGSFVMEDGGSRNKLYVDGSASSKTVLTDGLIIGIGSREYQIQVN